MADNRGLKFTFKDAGDYVGSPSLANVPSLATVIRALRYNRGGNRFIGVDIFNKPANRWDNIATFSQKANDWGYNVGDVAITVMDDGTVFLMTNAGDVGGNEIKEAWLQIPPHISGIPAIDGKRAVEYTSATTDQFARDQIAATINNYNAAIRAANEAKEMAKNMTELIKKEVDNKFKNVKVGLTEAQVKTIFWNMFSDRLYVDIINNSSALAHYVDGTAQYWGWTKGRDAAYALLKETGLIK